MARIPKLPGPLWDFRNALGDIWEILNLPEPTPIQIDVADFLQQDHDLKLIEGYRGMAKTYISVAWSVHEHRLEVEKYGVTNLHTLFGSAGKDFADTISGFAKKLMVEVPFYQCLLPGSDQLTSNVKFDVGPKQVSKDPSFKSAGIFGAMEGSRAERMFLDDVEVPNTAGTVGMRDKLRARVMGVSDLLPPEGGRLVVLGTPHFEDSLYNWVTQSGDWRTRVYPARYPTPERQEQLGDNLAPILRHALEADPSLAGQPTDPLRFDEEALIAREARSTRTHFARQYLLDTTVGDKEVHPLRLGDLIVTDLPPFVGPALPIWGSGSPIEDIPIWGLTGDRYNRPVRTSDVTEMAEYTGSVLAIDPSGRGKDETSWCISKMLNATVFVNDFGGYMDGFEDATLRGLAEKAKQYRVNAIRIESNFGDGMFARLLQPHLRAIKYPCQIIDERSTGQKEARICDTLEPLMNQHRLVVDANALRRDAAPRDGMGAEAAMSYRLAYQMSRITRDRGCLHHDDRVDVLAMACGHWVEHMGQSAQESMDAEADHDMDDVLRDWGAEDSSGANWTETFLPNSMR